MVASDADQEKQRLKKYFEEHAIQDKLNDMLNDMVQVRPNAPFGWLAKRMRAGGPRHTASAGTVPAGLGAAAKSAMGSELEKQWGFVLGLQATGSGVGPAAGPTAGAPKAGSATDVLLTIEAAGDGVLLCIRDPK